VPRQHLNRRRLLNSSRRKANRLNSNSATAIGTYKASRESEGLFLAPAIAIPSLRILLARVRFRPLWILPAEILRADDHSIDGDMMETFYYSRMQSPAGPLLLALSDKGLVLLEFDRGVFPPRKTEAEWMESQIATRPYVCELNEYFAGERRDFTFRLDLRGTDFQVKCWRALLDIPYGETRSYAAIARAVGQPKGFRAVGLANNRNPIAIVVPCHRVIASDGTLCGYGGGLEVKRKLLELEGALSAPLIA
jgi:methylated-DNA-[protein]-cysteine S-methyltransferase